MTINRSTLRRTAVALVAAGTASLMPAACGSGGDGAPAHGSHASASASAPASAGSTTPSTPPSPRG